MYVQFRSSQTIGARVLSSHGDEPPVGVSSSGNERIPDVVRLLPDGSTNPGGGGRKAESRGPRLEWDAEEGCRLCTPDLEGPAVFVGVDSTLGRRSRGIETGVPTGSCLGGLTELLLTEPPCRYALGNLVRKRSRRSVARRWLRLNRESC